MPAAQQIYDTQRLDERLVEVLSSSSITDQLRRKSASAGQQLAGHATPADFRPNDALDAAMGQPTQAMPPPSSVLRQNDLLDAIMGAGGAQPPQQSTALVPAGQGERGLELANIFRQLVQSIDGKLQPGGGGRSLVAQPDNPKDCDYCGLMQTLVAAAQSIDRKMDKVGGGSPMQALTFGQSADLPDTDSWVQNLLDQLQDGFQEIIDNITINQPPPKEEPKEPSWWDKLKKQVGGAVSSFAGANTAPVATHGMGGGIGAAGDTLKGIGGIASLVPVVGKSIEALTKLGDVAFKGVDRLQQWSERLYSANMQFAEFSASMAGIQAEQEARDITLSAKRGERRAGTSKDLAEAKSGLAESTSKWGDAVGNLQNKLFAVLINEVANPILKRLDFIADWINSWSNKEKGAEMALGEWERGVQQWQKDLQDQGRPARFR